MEGELKVQFRWMRHDDDVQAICLEMQPLGEEYPPVCLASIRLAVVERNPDIPRQIAELVIATVNGDRIQAQPTAPGVM